MKSHTHSAKIFFILLLSYFSFAVYSQNNLAVVKNHSNVAFRSLNIENGLSTLFIEHILQDNYGFVWIGTQFGLNVFDGHEIKVYKSENTDSLSLCSDFVTKVFEDKSWNIWVCTNRGISLFNRSNETFKSFYPDSSDINSEYNNILGIEEDSKGLLWVFTPEALFSFNKETRLFKDYSKDSIILKNSWTFYSKFVKRTCEDHNSNIWFTSSYGLKKFDRKKEKFISYNFNPKDSTSISSDDLIAIEKDKTGNIWFTTSNSGLNKIIFKRDKTKGLDSVSFKHYNQATSKIVCDTLINIYLDSKQNIWFTGSNGISKYNYKKDEFETFRIKGKKVLKMLESTYRGFWIRTVNDFYWFRTENKTLVEYTNYEGIKNMKGKYFYTCNKGFVWSTFEGYGIQIAYSWESPIKNFFNDNELRGLYPDNKINKLILDKNDNLWLGTYEGLIRINNFSSGNYHNFKVYKHNRDDANSIAANNILALCEASDGTIWAGTTNGLSKFNPTENNFHNYYHDKNNPNSLQFKYVQDVYEDSRGILWVLTQNGPDILDIHTDRFYHLKDYNKNIKEDFNLIITEDTKGSIWIGDFEQGIIKLDFPASLSDSTNVIEQVLNNFKLTTFKNHPNNSVSLSGNSVSSIHADENGRMWVGTGNGLNLYLPEESKFFSIGESDGLENKIICGILDDKDGNIWLSTKRGISKLIFAGNDYSSMLREKVKVINYNMSDGLQGLEYIEKSFFKARNGLMFFGGFNGFNFFHPDSIKTETSFPEIYITKFNKFHKRVFFKKPVYEIDEIVLKHNEDVFSLEFVAIEYKNPDEINYKYMLEGFDQDWISCGNQKIVNYTSIPSGEYLFRVMASNDMGQWNGQNTSLKITIKPPFWATWWFISIFAIFIISLLITYIKIREKNLRTQKDHLQSEVKERTIEITRKNEELQLQNEEITTQRDQLSLQNMAINESILYAKRIQTAVLPRQEYIDEILPENFILFKPRDVVSGDFYWIRQINHYIVIAVADCTGHGVPGAIMSMLGISFLNEIVQKREITQTNQALNELRKQIKHALKQTGKKGEADDGMDMALCALDTKTNTLQYAGAVNSIYLIKDSKFIEIKADRMPIGYYPNEKPTFTNHEIQLNDGDIFYLFSDGFMDQFGGKKGFKYKTGNFQNILVENHNKPMVIQKELLEQELKTWMKGYEQTDDILVMGVRV